MAVLGRLRHPNIVPLNAYYYARDEKLLVYEYMPNGSLFSVLHGKSSLSLCLSRSPTSASPVHCIVDSFCWLD
jgi:serine/threonine protein kinase